LKISLLLKVFLLSAFILGLSSSSFAQEKKGKRIVIKFAEEWKYSKQRKLGKSGKEEKNRLLGNVVFEHEGAVMNCDSAWLFSNENRIQAFSNVKINQGDTLFLWGDYLDYSGNTKLAVVTGDTVRLKDPKMELTTQQLNFNRRTERAYYPYSGTIVNDENILTSKKGDYNTIAKTFYFKDSVLLVNPDYTIVSDTLIYNTISRFAYFYGPTTITSDSSSIYCENGQYNTILDIAQFKENAILYSKNKYLKGDSLYYEAKQDYGEVFENVFIHDTVENYVITGNYGQYNGSKDSAFVTIDPIYSVLQDGDTLHIHGDTLLSAIRLDSLQKEYRLIRVFHAVKFFKKDLQGKCDSLTYASLDSTLKMYVNPILWNDSNQITGDTIYLTLVDQAIDSLKVYGNAFIISQLDDIKYNQIKGRMMKGKFYNNELNRVFVNGNGQTIYYPKDESKDYIGMNKSVSSYINIVLNGNKLKRISFLQKPEVKLHALNKVSPADQKLEGFNSYFDLRPKSKSDLLK
jgi:lipopolysaccharide export system protein LptA